MFQCDLVQMLGIAHLTETLAQLQEQFRTCFVVVE